MRSIDQNFDPSTFLDGAEKAFRMIVAAFAAGDRANTAGPAVAGHLQCLRAGDQCAGTAGQKQVSAIHTIHSATIEDAELRGTGASVTVRFVSDQTSLTQDKEGHPVTGTDAVTEITDIWTFERDLARATRCGTWLPPAARNLPRKQQKTAADSAG